MIEVLFRVDASVSIGTGHVMRCLTLAEALRARGTTCTFLCAELPGHMNGWIGEKGFEVLTLAEDSAFSPSSAIDRLEGKCFDWLVVDHYGLNAEWESAMRPSAQRVLVVDDLANRHHDCELLLDQNYFPSPVGRYNHLTPAHCSLLAGPGYALLRPDFALAGGDTTRRENERVLVFFGGSDPAGATLKALEALRGLKRPTLAVDVVVGNSNPQKTVVQALCRELGASFHCQVDNMAELMGRATLSVGAGGTATWERLSAGLPAIVLTIADNQVEITRNLAHDGYLLYLGSHEEVNEATIARQIEALLDNPALRAFLSRHGRELVDGQGANRVARILCQPPLTLRQAEPSDCEQVFTWRNDESNRRFALDPAEIDWETHAAWFNRTLANPHRVLLIGESKGEPVGVLRYDLDGEGAVVSVYLVPGTHGRGFGTALLEEGSRWLQKNCPGIRYIDATILDGNQASLKAFRKAGYRPHSHAFRKWLSPAPACATIEPPYCPTPTESPR